MVSLYLTTVFPTGNRSTSTRSNKWQGKGLHLNSMFRDIGRCFRQSLRPLLTPAAPRWSRDLSHSFCHLRLNLSALLFTTSSKNDTPFNQHPFWAPGLSTSNDRTFRYAVSVARWRHCQHNDGVSFHHKDKMAPAVCIHSLKRFHQRRLFRAGVQQSHTQPSIWSVYLFITSLLRICHISSTRCNTDPEDYNKMIVQKHQNIRPLTAEHYRRHRQQLADNGFTKKPHVISIKNNIKGIKKWWKRYISLNRWYQLHYRTKRFQILWIDEWRFISLSSALYQREHHDLLELNIRSLSYAQKKYTSWILKNVMYALLMMCRSKLAREDCCKYQWYIYFILSKMISSWQTIIHQ